MDDFLENKATVVISQPMFFPWVGMFEQYRLANTFVYYDDVQFSKGSFTNRVQVKTEQGGRWLSVPLKLSEKRNNINKVLISENSDWRTTHLALLSQVYEGTRYLNEMLKLVESVYSKNHTTISSLAIDSMEHLANYFDLARDTYTVSSSALNIPGKSSERVLAITKYFNAKIYVTGLGAWNYLDHQIFDKNGIDVCYMQYCKRQYKQKFGEFTPFVSTLDLIANLGAKGREYIDSQAEYYRNIQR